MTNQTMTNQALKTIYACMTPTQKSAFNIIQLAAAAGLITAAEQSAIKEFAETDLGKWEALVTSLRLRLAQAQQARLMIKAKSLLM